MIIINKKINKKGFVLLFAMVLSSIVLAIALGVMNIALKEINFSTSGKDSNDAFLAADTGAECALFWDNPINNAFDISYQSSNIVCSGQTITFNPLTSVPNYWGFIVPSSGKSCAIVTITKDPNAIPPTVITSTGRSDCSGTNNYVERQLEVKY